MLNKHFIFSLIIACLLFTSCNKDKFSLFSTKTQLTKNKWVLKSLTDYRSNTDFPVSNTIYEFKNDGTYIIRPSNFSTPIFTTWELLDHKQYLKIGSNTFRISYISNRLLGLRYGNLALFYVPAEK